MLKLLFIEDELNAVKPVQNLIKRENRDMHYKESGFEDAKDKIASFRPHIVILDLLVNGASVDPEPGGLGTYDFIWDKHFCPIVVYSAQPDIHRERYESHPFVKTIQKGAGSPRRVLKALDELRSHVEALREAEKHIQYSFSLAMRDVAPYAFKAFSDDTQRIEETIKRSGRRRVAALMDEPLPNGKALASWEQYLFPPVCNDTQLGDVLRKEGGGDDDPASFRVVLTPSCDLVTSGNRKAKVSEVLVARCCSMKSGLDRTSLGRPRISKLGDRLRSQVLTQGYIEAVIPFPRLEDRIPTMAANLRDLEFIPIGDIGSDRPFLRIASIDSPFRELVAWAYLQTACRPGLPDRDFDSWRDEIVANWEIEGSGEEK